MGSGTTFKEVSGKTMKAVQVRVPCKIEDQKKIASILDSIDSKIENNAKINDNLEQQAEAIFDASFDDIAIRRHGSGRMGNLDYCKTSTDLQSQSITLMRYAGHPVLKIISNSTSALAITALRSLLLHKAIKPEVYHT